MDKANDVWDSAEEEEDLRDEGQIGNEGNGGNGGNGGDEGDEGDEEENEEDVNVFQKMIDVVENHEGEVNLLYSGAGMYLLGMTFGWTAFRVIHTRKAVLNDKKILGVTTHSLAFPYGGYEAAPQPGAGAAAI